MKLAGSTCSTCLCKIGHALNAVCDTQVCHGSKARVLKYWACAVENHDKCTLCRDLDPSVWHSYSVQQVDPVGVQLSLPYHPHYVAYGLLSSSGLHLCQRRFCSIGKFVEGYIFAGKCPVVLCFGAVLFSNLHHISAMCVHTMICWTVPMDMQCRCIYMDNFKQEAESLS